MPVPQLMLHHGLQKTSRLPALSRAPQLSIREWLVLILCGGASACAATMLDFGLKSPGHAILRSIFPLAFGLALVPRRYSGSVMGIAALAAAAGIAFFNGLGFGYGALTSLSLIGPLLDLAVRGVERGRMLYLRFALAGLATNLAAYSVKFAAKYFHVPGSGGRGLAEWSLPAAGSYVVCGIVAGLFSAFVWFRFSAGSSNVAETEREP